MPVLGTFAAALPLHFPPPPVSHPNDALKNSKNTESSRTPLSTLQKKPKPAEPLVGAYFTHHSPIPAFITSLTSPSPRLTPASPAYHFMIILWSVQLFEKSEASTTASPNPSIFPATKKAPYPLLHLTKSPPPIKTTPKPKNTAPTDRSCHSVRLHFSLAFNFLIPTHQTIPAPKIADPDHSNSTALFFHSRPPFYNIFLPRLCASVYPIHLNSTS